MLVRGRHRALVLQHNFNSYWPLIFNQFIVINFDEFDCPTNFNELDWDGGRAYFTASRLMEAQRNSAET